MQSTVVVISALLAVFLCLASASDDLPQQRERRASPDDVKGFEVDEWEDGGDIDVRDGYRPGALAKRIADNDFIVIKHEEVKNNLRHKLYMQQLDQLLEKAGKRSFADKRSLAQNDFAMQRQDMAKGRLYRSLLDRLLSQSGR